MIEDTLSALSGSIEDVNKKFYGVVVGTVINPVDPLMLGRVQVRLPFIDSADLSPWARVATMMAGATHGTFFIPNVGDEVLIAFEHGDVNVPYVIGSLWNATSPPPLPSPLPQIRMIRTLAGNQIMFTEAPPTITISTPSGQMVVLAPTGVQVTSHASLISITPDGVTISGNPNLNLVASASINLQAPTITIDGAAATNLQSAGVCTVTGALVKVN